jgi:GTP-binding protein YchF
LVKGAAEGQGLGNKFLANIREVDAIIYVLRAFSNKNIINTQSEINPLAEKEILDIELLLKDLETVKKRIDGLAKDIKANKKDALQEFEILKIIKDFLENGKILSEQNFKPEWLKTIKQYQLLTFKPRLYLLNGSDKEIPQNVLDEFKKNNWEFLTLDILTEFEASDLKKEERLSFGLMAESGLDFLIKKAYQILGLITFFTTGPDETRAWTIEKGKKAPQAGGVIHSDFETHFIKAEIINWKNLTDANGFASAREKGLLRFEGKEYIVQDGDVVEIKHNA